MSLDYWIARAMQTYGGSFVVNLGSAFIYADPENKGRLLNAFPEIFDHYIPIAEKLKQEDDAKP